MVNLLSIASVLSTVGSVLLAILVLLIMITVHEFGHYIVGKIFKFKINEFAIGMGPAIFKKENKETGEVFSIRALPLGGFCAFEGEDENSDNPNAFNNKAPWKRILVLIAGATMNLIIGVLVLVLSVGIYGQISIKTYDIRPDTNPIYAGYSLENDDLITKIEGKTIFMATDVVDALKGKKQGDVVTVAVTDKSGNKTERKVRLRNDVNSENLTDVFSAFTAIGVSTIEEIEEISNGSSFLVGDLILRVNSADNYDDCQRIFNLSELVEYAKTVKLGDTLGVYVIRNNDDEPYLVETRIETDFNALTDSEILNAIGIKSNKLYLKYQTENVKFGFFETISRGVKYSVTVAGTIFTTLGELLTGKLGIEAVGGPITTISVTSEAIREGGFNFFLEMLGFIGVNLAVFNLLPIPALDGSRVVFTAIEWIRKKPVNRKVEGIIHAVGLMVLLGFCILVDLLQIF